MVAQSNDKRIASWQKVLGVGVIGALIVGLITLALLWPVKVAEPHKYPIAITGSSTVQRDAIKNEVSRMAGDTIEFIDAQNRDEAVQKIHNREVFGALIVQQPNPEVLTASANGQVTNAVMTTMASTLQGKINAMIAAQSQSRSSSSAPKVTVTTTDIVPAHSAKFDIAQLVLPLVLGGIIGGAIIPRAVRGRWSRVSALAVYSLFAGGALSLVAMNWFDLLPTSWAIVGAISLGIFATASFVAGSSAQFGIRGLAAAAVITLLLANPLSGMMVPSLFLPEPWGAIGQGLTIGATGTLLRIAAYFPSADITTPVVTLCAWSILGTLAVIVTRKPQSQH